MTPDEARARVEALLRTLGDYDPRFSPIGTENIEVHRADAQALRSLVEREKRLTEAVTPFDLDEAEFEDVPDEAVVHLLIMGGEELANIEFRHFRRLAQVLKGTTPDPEGGK